MMKKVNLSKKDNMILSLIAIVVLIICLFIAEPVFGKYVSRIIKLSAIYAICALSMNMVNGFTGLFSLGQPGFMAIGAYTTAILTLTQSDKQAVFYMSPMPAFLERVHLPFIIALILGGLLAAACAYIIGFPVLRLRGDYLAIATLGFSEIIRVILQNMQNITNGPLGINKIPNHVSMWMAFGVLAIITIFMLVMMKTSYGRALKAIREDEIAAEAMGIDLFKHKMLAFVLSGFIAGIAGGLLGSLVGAIDPTQFKFTFAYTLLLMVVLGGQGSISGSIVGAFIITCAQEILRFVDEPINLGFIHYPGIEGMRMVVFSVMLMCIILFWSKGIFGNKEFSWSSFFGLFKRKQTKVTQETKEV